MRLIDADAAIEALNTQAEEMSHWSERYQEQRRGVLTAVNIVADCPSVQPNHCAEVGKKVLIDRQEALEAIGTLQTYKLFAGDDMILIDKAEVQTELTMLPPAEPEQRWIPCSKQLPEKEGWYITTVESEKTGKRRIENDLFAVDIALAHGHTPNKFCKDGYKQKTVAWMPFPEPYRKRGEQNG